MLDQLRRPGRAKSIFATVVFGLICLVFVFFGFLPDQFGLSTGGAAAVVDKTPISMADFQDRRDRLRDLYSRRFGGAGAAQQQFIQNMVKNQALEGLIDFEVIVQGARQEGFVASDDEVMNTIVSIPAFQENERFQRDRYDAYIKNSNTSVREFETKIRKELVFNRMRESFARSMWPGDLEANKQMVADKMTLNLAFMELSRRDLEEKYKPSAKEVKAFAAEETEAIKKYYDENKADYAVKEQVRARHILIKVDPNDKEGEKKAFAKIKELQEKAKTADFAKLAKENSQDTGTASRGGDLGFFQKGAMVPPFELVAFKSEVGKISSPVKTKFGYHLIKVLERKEAKQKELAEVQSEIAKKLLVKNQVKDLFKKLASQEGAPSHKEVMKTYGLKWQETGDFKINAAVVPVLGDKDKVLAKAISLKNKKGQVASVEDGDSFYFVKLKSFAMEPGQPKVDRQAASESLSGLYASQGFADWKEGRKEKVKIQRNAKILQ